MPTATGTPIRAAGATADAHPGRGPAVCPVRGIVEARGALDLDLLREVAVWGGQPRRVAVGPVDLVVTERGEGPTVVLVHGSWDDHSVWSAVAARLADDFRVIAYDRRGHGGSSAPPGQGTLRQDVADLCGIVEQVAAPPTHVVGHSYGACVVLLLARERPDLLAGVAVHEPPLFGVLDDDPRTRPLLEATRRTMGRVAQLIAHGDPAAAARTFAEQVTLDGQAWEEVFDPHLRSVWTTNAATWLDQYHDAERLLLSPGMLADSSLPVLITTGTRSPATFAPGCLQLAAMTPNATHQPLVGVGHFPHVTYPAQYASCLAAHLGRGGASPTWPGT